MAVSNKTTLYLRPLPFLDSKWLSADLISSLRNDEDAAILWNNLIQDSELVSSQTLPVINKAGNLSYLGDGGKHYCGVERLECLCCSCYCGPLSGCNCGSCRLLDSDLAIKKITSNVNLPTTNSSESVFQSWLWGQTPDNSQKANCLKAMFAELHEVSLQAAGNCLSSVHLRQQLYIYERYYVALTRCMKESGTYYPFIRSCHEGSATTTVSAGIQTAIMKSCKADKFKSVDGTTISKKNNKCATMGLAQVGTRAALNFSFAFLRRAWRSGEDTEICSELLSEALSSLQDLPEASLFNTYQVSSLWIEVLERSMKFLRQVALGDVMGGRCTAPREDRHTALCLLLELGVQKGTLSASLEAIVLLLMLWEKEKETDDNRNTPQNSGAPLIPILKRYENISNYGVPSSSVDILPASATESFLRFFTLPVEVTSNIDLKQSAVVIVSHLDRLAKPHMPTGSAMPEVGKNNPTILKCQLPNQLNQPPLEQQQVFALGWLELCNDHYGFAAESSVGMPVPGIQSNYPLYTAPIVKFSFQVKQVTFSEENVLFLTQCYKVYSWKIANPELEPVLVSELYEINIQSISSHYEGRHYLALDSKGFAYSWGIGDGGRLGHGDTLPLENPQKIKSLENNVRSIHCGCSYSAAITSNGKLYTWGRGTYGRLGHGNSDDKLTPTLVKSLLEYEIADVSLGSGDSHTLCVTTQGLVFAWGDGDYGKLGNGLCNGSQLPVRVETLPRVQRVFTGSQFSLALSCDGKVYTWGKASGGRLGHGCIDKSIPGAVEIVNTPKVIKAFEGKFIVNVAVGATHCLALSITGEVLGWGRNDCQQVCPQGISKDPILSSPILASHPSVRVSGISCGATQSIIWSQASIQEISTKTPFVIDLSDNTFRLLDQLLGIVCGHEVRQTPNQESECIAVACLNLLRLQLHALIVNGISPKTVGLNEGSRLLLSLKSRILGLAGGSCILKTMQEAAQWTLQIGWSILLPTVSERAHTLTSLLPSEAGCSSTGHRFMTDLLVGSLMAEGGLEIALNQSIRSENPESPDSRHHLPLLHLIKQLLRNNSALTQTRLSQHLISASMTKADNDGGMTLPEHITPSLNLLHRFQRLLLSHIHQSKADDSFGAETLLSKYIQSTVVLCVTSLQRAHEVALQGKNDVVDILKSDISDTLLNEMLIGLVLLNRDKPSILQQFNWTKTFLPLLHALDNLNRVMCDSEIQDSDDMGWPGIICRGTHKTSPIQEEPMLIRKNDFENQISDGGKFVIIHGYVCDLNNYLSDVPAINELIENGVGKDLTFEFNTPNRRHIMEYIINNYKVGKYAPNVLDEKPELHHFKILTHSNSERTLSFLLGLVTSIFQAGPSLQPAELQCKTILQSKILSGGLQVLQPANPFDDEKGEARSSASTAGSTPTEPCNHQITCCLDQTQQRIELLISGLGEARLADPLVLGWMAVSERFCKDHNLIWHQEFPPEHPVQELERLLTAVLIRHQNIGALILPVIDLQLSGFTEKPPKHISEIVRLVHQTKWTVVKKRQQLNRSYKEVCAPMLERLRFLLYEVRPALSLEQSGLQKLCILHKFQRFKSVVKKIIFEMRIAKNQLAFNKPEDLLNATIQSQHAAFKNPSQETHSLVYAAENLDKEPESQRDSTSSRNYLFNENLIETGTDNNIFCVGDKKAVQDDESGFGNKEANRQSVEQVVVNDVNFKLSKQIQRGFNGGMLCMTTMYEVVDFVMQELCDVESVRRAMYCQVQRYLIRRQGFNFFLEILQVKGLLDAVQYNMLSGYLGLSFKETKETTVNVLDDLNLITAFQKADLILTQSKVFDWAISELQQLVNQEQISMKPKFHCGKDNSNLGTYVFLKKLSRARFLLSVFGILAKDVGPNEMCLLVNSGILGTILGLLHQTGGDIPTNKKANEVSVVYEDTILKQKSNKSNLTGPDLAKLMKIGTRICRGVDWKWGDQDGNPPGEGRIISEVGEDGWVRVEWYTGATNSYRMGKEGQYDLRLAENSSNIVSPDAENIDKDELIVETQLSGESHPTKLLRYACTKMLQIISVEIGQHSEKTDKTAIKGLTSMFQAFLNPKSSLGSICGLDSWTTLGFLRAIVGESKSMSKFLTTSVWIDFYIDLLDRVTSSEQDLYKKIHCLRLLQTVLMNWTPKEIVQTIKLIQQLFSILGKTTLYCPNDFSLDQNTNYAKPRVLLTASHSGTVAEEIITLLRKLHTLPVWNPFINSILSQKLCVAAEIFGVDGIDVNNLEAEYVHVMGVLSTIGGCDTRPRVGLQVVYEGSTATICGFTNKGKCILSMDENSRNEEFRKISLKSVLEGADYSVFSLSRLPMNEMLLNSWSVLMYGPRKRNESVIHGPIDIPLLRLQQIQICVLSSNCVLYRHQTALRKILKQRSPGIKLYLSEESISEEEHQQKSSEFNVNDHKASGDESPSSLSETETLIQSILIRATQPSPLKASYSYADLTTAAINVSQMLTRQAGTELNDPGSPQLISSFSPVQSTLIHGVPFFNYGSNDIVSSIKQNLSFQDSCSVTAANRNKGTTCPLVSQIIEMGFYRKTVELALKTLSAQTEVTPTPEQIVQWILENPDPNPPMPSTSKGNMYDTGGSGIVKTWGHDPEADSDNDSTNSSDTVEGSIQEAHYRVRTSFATRKDFHLADQYAMYVRRIVCPGMIVRCCRDFEEIKKGDIGTVLKVDTEGLHDLNVQVNWQMHSDTYWVCFVHIELLEMPKKKSTQFDRRAIVVGSQVRIRSSTRFKWSFIPECAIGTVISRSGNDVVVNFPQQKNWSGSLNEIELVNGSSGSLHRSPSNLILDWSRCIRELTVSSNESTAKHLLDKSPNCWESSSNSQGKHWIRIEMHANVIIHNMSIAVNPLDCSHMPSLIVTRVGDSIQNLKEYSWVSVKNSDLNVSLLNEVQQYYKYIEVVIKQCKNNGMQCKVHGVNIIGRHRQTELDAMLIDGSFLACEYDNLFSESNTLVNAKSSQGNTPCTVMVWGLNDKEQLGGLKGSKVKVPTFSQTLCRLRPIYIAGGSKSLFIVSQDGKVYACGEGTNGRLGLGHNCNIAVPRQIPVLHQYVVKKVSVHSGGKHALALTLDGKVFSWGEGEDGKLGHGNRLTMDKPKMIESLRSKKIRDIACGSSHSAAISSAGELYTWGLGEYGRLGHGDNTTQLKPKLVSTLIGKRVIQVACGSRDAQTLALSEDGAVYSWGDGDFGKLGRGGSEGSSVPHEIERLTGIGVIQIECGAQFSLALTRTGEVWTWGKGDYYRLGHGSDQHVRKPAPILCLRDRKVIHVAVGALHCLAVTDSGKVFAWGDNDHGQQGSGNTLVNKKPTQVIGLDSVFVNRVACGSSHSVAWGLPQLSAEEEKKGPVPFPTTKDPLGGSGLGIYESESSPSTLVSSICKPQLKFSLTETLLSLDTFGARQTALNYVLNAMSILQARQLIVAALASHSKINQNEKMLNEVEQSEYMTYSERVPNISVATISNNEIIAQGGGEGPADATDPAVYEKSPEVEVLHVPAGAISTFQSMTGSLSLSTSISSNTPHKHSKMSASAMSVMAATMTYHEEMNAESSLNGLDDFTSMLGETEAKSLVELLKLSVAGRTGPESTSQTIADALIALGLNSLNIGAMLLETCITELEDLCTSRHSLDRIPKPVAQESSHPYVDNVTTCGHVKIPGAEALRLEFDSQCSTEKRNDPLVIMDGSGKIVATRSGREFSQWAQEIRIAGDEVRWKFTSDSSVNGWGWKFWVHAIMPATSKQERGSDRSILSQPSILLVMALLDSKLRPTNNSVLLRLAAALAACAQLNSLTPAQRIWSLKKLHFVLTSKHAPKVLDSSLNPILMPLIPELLRQYDYEEPQVRGGIHLMHSDYLKMLAALACDMQLDSVLPPADMHKWVWFKRYCIAVRVAQSLINRTELPRTFCLEVKKKLSEMIPSRIASPSTSVMINSAASLSSSTTSNATPTPPPSIQQQQLPLTTAASMVNSLTPSTSNLIQYIDSVMSLSMHDADQKNFNGQTRFLHEDHTLFKVEHDSQLLQWLNRRPEDWALSWGGASTIYGWGHNHRGQLGGLEGSRIKAPTPCEALSLLRPLQLAGGEQTLYAVTPDGKLFATGYGSGGRLGIAGTESVSTPTLVESLQHVFVKKIAVNSGGKHCLSLSADGEVYSWGEGEDGKLGHSNRASYDRPKLIDALSGIGIVDIACGSAHSACITSSGHVLTWGKGRYGRLGHGDSEDQLRPKLVEALLGYRAVDIACGSGDAQTLCITDDDNVWSWGDGDYGKLGRGGSDGCKIPMKIESLSGLGVIKVECGSQFSVALTRSGAVYTWGKGDYHRLGHGTVDHVRRPKKVAALQGKKIISIATGSLHCVACSETGEVYTWGDNDEGQLGDGTVSAIQRPRLVTALQEKHIVKVTCGSAHTLALSTSQLTERVRPHLNPPLEYDLVRDFSAEALHARLVLLHHFSELVCPCLAMLPITGELSLSALKDVLVYTIKEAAFRKVIQTTMVRDKQHGPIIELNRIQVKRSRNKSSNGLAGIDGMKSVFGQMVQKLPLLTQEALSLPHRVWKVKFVGESVDDCGGGYSESIAEMCDELQNGSVPLLINTPNGRGEAGANRDCFLLDPTLTSVLQMNMFRFLGVLMGIAIRTGSPLSLNMAEPVWRQLAGENLRPSDLSEIDRDYVAGLLCIRNMEEDQKVFNTLELPFSTSSAKGHEVRLSTRYTRITPQNRHEYVRLALNFRLHEFDEQVNAVRDGMSKVIPVPLLSLFSAAELQAIVCGSPDIPLGLLKTVATYKGFDPNSVLVSWFWDVMEDFSNQERSLFLRFVWGRTRLPRTIADFRGRDFVFQVLEKSPPDNFLPESYTCFFLLKMPRYSCKTVLREKLKYAIHFCKSIDTDEYARVAMGDPTEATGSEDNSDLESIASNDA